MRFAAILIFLIVNGIQLFAQTFGGGTTTPVVNCTILPNTPVCPNSVNSYSAPAGMTGYAWSIIGDGTLSGPVNQRTVTVRAGAGCNTTYKLTVVVTNNSIVSACSQIIAVKDVISPTIIGAQDKTIPSGSQNIIFDNPTFSDLCGIPTLTILSTTNATLPNGWTTYTRTWKATDACGNSSTCAQVVTVANAMICTINGSSSVCQGSSMEICASQGAASYSWSTGATTPCITITSGGNYTVTIVDAQGTSSSCSKIVSTSTPAGCLITGNETICSGGSTNLCAPAGAVAYSWSTGATTRCIDVTTPGTYTVNITEANGCISSCSKTVSILTAPDCMISGNSSLCTGSSISICATAGASSYLWNTGATTQCLTVTAAGTYSVTVTNSNGCTKTCTKIITENSTPSCSITGNLLICPGGSSQLCAPSNMSSYLWSTGATTSCISVTSLGTYNVRVTNSNGCTATCTQNVDTRVAPVCNITGNSNICPGGTSILCAPAGMTAYSWNTGATTQCITVNTAGTFTVTITNSMGCTSTCSKTINARNPPVCVITGNSTFCDGSFTSLCAPSGASSYSWNTGATTQCITVTSAGTYSVSITDVNGCTNSSSKVVTVNNLQQCSISGNSTLCVGGSTTLCAPAGASLYSWSNGATTQCITVTSAGNYTVTIIDANGCSNVCSKNVVMIVPQQCSITGNNYFCAGGSTNLCASVDAQSYLWNTGATTKCISVTTAGTYTVTVTDVNGCTSTCSKTVTMYLMPTSSINGTSSFCAGGSTNLCGTAGTLSYAWSTGATTPCISVTTPGAYSLTITSNYGCSSSSTKNITIKDPPVCSVTGNQLICNGNSSQLCAPSGLNSYLWSNGSTTQCLNVITSGNYSVRVTGSNGCTSTCSQNIDILNPPGCSITGNTSICVGGSTSLCASPGGATYLWSTGATTQCITASSAANYTVTVTGINGCTSSCTKTVIVNTPLTCSITGNSSICSGASTNLCVPAGGGSYAWSTEATTNCITVNSSGTYSVVITDANGCVTTCSKTVTVNQMPTCSITGGNEICQGVNSVFTAGGGNSYLWSNGATTPAITVTNAGVYSVTVSNNNGCTSTCSRSLVTHGCGISLKKSPDICEFPQGTPTTVNFKYVVKNTGDFYPASGTLVDDNGTPSILTDDLNVCSWGPLAPGDSATCNRAITISNTHTNIAKAIGTSGSKSVNATSTATVTGINCNCNLNYPDNSNLPRSAVIFNESEILRASDPGTTACGTTGSVIKMWYNDEHALLLGVRAVNVKTFSGITTTNYNVTPAPGIYGCVTNPLVGDTISSGDQAANDLAAGGGRPLWPAIFITDLTVNGPNSRIGDWQQGGKGIMPTRVCGTWKAAIKTIDKTRNPPTVTIVNDINPPKNDWNLGSGSHTPPGGFANLDNEGYGAEIMWDVNTLGLIPGHTYRLVFMVHDGDQNKTGGDVGESCTTIHIPESNCIPVPPPPPPANKICYTGTTNSYVKASQQWSINTTTNQATIRTTFSKNFVDNTYGVNAINWPSGHTFSQLAGTEYLQMALYDASNAKKMEFKLDYITASNTVPSGYKTLGIGGGEGSMILGNATDVISVSTSLDKNLNTLGYPLITNSPSTNSTYSPNVNYPNWIYDVWYEVTVKLSAFGSPGFGKPSIASIYASPSKTGSNTEMVMDTICTQTFPRISAPDSPTKINAIAYPNPFGEDITINFITPLEEEATITISDLTGRVVESFKSEAGTISTGQNLKAGIYFVTITQGNFYRMIKIVKSAGN